MEEICVFSCKENFPNGNNDECKNICVKGSKIVNDNPFAYKIISHFIHRIKEERFLQVNTEIKQNKPIDEQIDDMKEQIGKEKDAVLTLENHLLELQKLKTIELRSKLKAINNS